MATRKILSFSATYDAYIFPDLPLQERPIIGVTTAYSSQFVFDESGNIIGEETLATEHDVFDENWTPEEPSIFLLTRDDRKYFSIDARYTLTKLKTTFNPELNEEPLFNLKLHTLSSLDSSFTDEILDTNLFVLNKYKEGNNYVNYLGIPQPTDPNKYNNDPTV